MKMKKLVSLGLGAAMALSVALPTFASDGEVNVKGSITLREPSVGPDGTYDVTIPSTVYWFVNDSNNRQIVNGTSGTPDSNVWGQGTYTRNTIKNNSTVDIGVTFKSFEQVLTNNTHASQIQSNLKLYLAGDLEVTGLSGVNLNAGLNSAASPIAIDALSNGETLDFGFKGEYNGLITNSTNYSPEYKMTLGFSLTPLR